LFGKGNINGLARFLRRDRFLHEIIEGRIRYTRRRGRRIQMLHDLANDALKRAAQDRGMETQRKDVKNLLYSRRLLN